MRDILDLVALFLVGRVWLLPYDGSCWMLSRVKDVEQVGHFLTRFRMFSSTHSLQKRWKHRLMTQFFSLVSQIVQMRSFWGEGCGCMYFVLE